MLNQARRAELLAKIEQIQKEAAWPWSAGKGATLRSQKGELSVKQDLGKGQAVAGGASRPAARGELPVETAFGKGQPQAGGAGDKGIVQENLGKGQLMAGGATRPAARKAELATQEDFGKAKAGEVAGGATRPQRRQAPAAEIPAAPVQYGKAQAGQAPVSTASAMPGQLAGALREQYSGAMGMGQGLQMAAAPVPARAPVQQFGKGQPMAGGAQLPAARGALQVNQPAIQYGRAQAGQAPVSTMQAMLGQVPGMNPAMVKAQSARLQRIAELSNYLRQVGRG